MFSKNYADKKGTLNYLTEWQYLSDSFQAEDSNGQEYSKSVDQQEQMVPVSHPVQLSH